MGDLYQTPSLVKCLVQGEIVRAVRDTKLEKSLLEEPSKDSPLL